MLTHTIAAVVLELFYLITGVVLSYLGLRLIEKGVEVKTRLEGSIAGNKWVLVTASPGIVFALSGVGIILYAIVNTAEYKESLFTANIPQDSISAPMNQNTGSIVQSRLLTDSSGISSLVSRLSLYKLQFQLKQRELKDISNVLKEFPKDAGAEPWPRTYDRIKSSLRDNPLQLLNMLRKDEYRWIVERDKKDGTLSALLDIETERLE